MLDRKFIVNFTPTGMIPTKKMTPYVPVLPDEIINDVLSVVELDVSMIHLHARIWYGIERAHLATNRDLVERIVDIAKILGYTPHTPGEVRNLSGCSLNER